ncbi:transketolase [Liquorilactobacillus mali]|uniref:Transketolase n=2 Tax=Liquorilactobacillus mali TaxID=1618 RepID=A0A0R2G253_9LACO|nr:transketolase [Liquorilactobacillus mali]
MLELKAAQMRLATWNMIYKAGTGHTGSDLSCADILVALYYTVMNQTPQTFEDQNCDHYIQSKGHAVEILYNVLADRGYFPKTDLESYSQFNSPYIGHPTNHVHGIEQNTGSLGHGLGLASGIALAGKLDHRGYHVYTLMGDGEQAEGSVWEAAMFAGNYHLDNLTAIIDHNKLQISGPITQVMNSESLTAKYEAFGFNVIEVNGNDISELVNSLKKQNHTGKPLLILANTIKGRGISFAENKAEWHHKVPSDEQYQQGVKELKTIIGGLKNE